MESGIYKITNVHNGKIYIGSTKHLKRREYEHFYKLSRNIHVNKHLQNSFNRGDKFIFEILENCEINLLEDIERKYIRIFNSTNSDFGYNIHSERQPDYVNKEFSDKISKIVTEQWTNGTRVYNIDPKKRLKTLEIKYRENPDLYEKFVQTAKNNFQKGFKLSRKLSAINRINNRNYDYYLFHYEKDKHYAVRNLIQFCKDFNLTVSSFYHIFAGRQSTHKGWKIAKIDKYPPLIVKPYIRIFDDSNLLD